MKSWNEGKNVCLLCGIYYFLTSILSLQFSTEVWFQLDSCCWPKQHQQSGHDSVWRRGHSASVWEIQPQQFYRAGAVCDQQRALSVSGATLRAILQPLSQGQWQRTPHLERPLQKWWNHFSGNTLGQSWHQQQRLGVNTKITEAMRQWSFTNFVFSLQKPSVRPLSFQLLPLLLLLPVFINFEKCFWHYSCKCYTL